jgi:hypothetical protein
VDDVSRVEDAVLTVVHEDPDAAGAR